MNASSPEWEPEPYELPLIEPEPHPTRAPGYDDDPDESESSHGVIVIDLA